MISLAQQLSVSRGILDRMVRDLEAAIATGELRIEADPVMCDEAAAVCREITGGVTPLGIRERRRGGTLKSCVTCALRLDCALHAAGAMQCDEWKDRRS